MTTEVINIEQVADSVIDVLITDGAAVPVQVETNHYFLLLPKISVAGTWVINGSDTGVKAVQSISHEVVAEINRRAEAAESAAEQAVIAVQLAAENTASAAQSAEAANQEARTARVGAEQATAAAGKSAASSDQAADNAQSAASSAAAAVDKVGALPKFVAWQSGYIPRAEFKNVPTNANGQWLQVNFPMPFVRRPNYINIELDIQSVSVFLQYKGNITETGFQIGSNYAAAIQGVFYSAGIIE